MNAYLQTIHDIEKGRMADELSDRLTDLVALVKERGKGGKLQLTITIKPLDSDAESVSVTATHKVTEPARQERASIFFTTDDNLLVRENPRQAEMKLEPVARPVGEIKPVAKSA